MKELVKTKRITIAVFAFIFVIVVGLLTIKEEPYSYKITPVEMTEEVMLVYQVLPDEAMELMWDTTAVFVDIRSIYDFERSHIENAINIPVPTLLSPENISLFEGWKKDSLKVIMYGNNELEANSPWILMYELGFKNTRTLMGGMAYIDKLYDGTLEENESYSVEDPIYDYAGVVKEAEELSGSTVVVKKEKKKVVVRKKKKKVAEGGC